jgi:hypothetical protein
MHSYSDGSDINDNECSNSNEQQEFPSMNSSQSDSNFSPTTETTTQITIEATTQTTRTESREKLMGTMRDVKQEESCRSLDVSKHVIDETPPPPVATRPTPRPAAWSVSSPKRTTTTTGSKSLAEIMNDEAKRRDKQQQAATEVENLRMVELAQEDEMIQLAMERSMTDFPPDFSVSGNSVEAVRETGRPRTSSIAKSVQEEVERTETFTTRPMGPRTHSSRKVQEEVNRKQFQDEVNRTETFTTRPMGPRSLSSKRLPDTSGRYDNSPSRAPSRSWSSLQCRQRPNLISMNSKRSILTQQRPCLDNLASVASGRQAVLEVARRNLSPLEVGLIERALEVGVTTRNTTPAGSQRDADGEYMFDLDPGSPTKETPRVELAVGGPSLPFDINPAPLRSSPVPRPYAQGSQAQAVSQNRSRGHSFSSLSPTHSSSSRISYGLEDSAVRLSSSPRPPTAARYLPLRPPLSPGTSAGVGTTINSCTTGEQNSSYFLEQAAQHLSLLELEEIKRALTGAKEEPSATATTTSIESPAKPPMSSSEAAMPSAAAVASSVVDDYDFSGAEDHLSEEELRQIQQALQDSSTDCEHTDQSQVKGGDESDLKPTSIPLNDKVISDDDTYSIERALREADEEEELRSIQLAIQMEEEEVSLQRQGVAARRGQGNVRTITRAELYAERSGRAGAFASSSPPRLRHPLEEAEEIPPAAGFRMNTVTSQEWARRDQNSVVGPNNEIRTKHDAELHGEANAQRLGLEADEGGSLRVGNKAYNSFIQSVRRGNKGPQVQGSRTRSDSDSDNAERKEVAPRK